MQTSKMFQYPLRVEVGCNAGRIKASTLTNMFQYPLRVEVGCNSKECLPRVGLGWFQYPLRVEVGCNRCRPQRAGGREWFQYPLRVEVGCNLRQRRRASGALQVSVPSTGRSGLQPQPTLGRGSGKSVSVPSTGRSGLQRRGATTVVLPSRSFSTLYGSKWVATAKQLHIAHARVRFQYPLRVEVGCNLLCVVRASAPIAVSVPSTGRSGLQPSTHAPKGKWSRSFSTLYGSKWVATCYF